MRPPSITDYIRTLEDPAGLVRTLGKITPERDIYTNIVLRAGNSAAVFKYTAENGESRMLKCYVRPNPYLHTLYEYIDNHRFPLLPMMGLKRNELFVYRLTGEGDWVDVVEGEWVTGETLDRAVEQAIRGTGAGAGPSLEFLARSFDRLCITLLEEEWAHGDLKPENIVVRPDGTLVLIDCDAMWIPPLAGQKASELGTPGYCHPERNAGHFDKNIDNYSMLLISASLHSLALEPGLYEKYHTADLLLLSPAEIIRGNSAAYTEIRELLAGAGMGREYRMAEALAWASPVMEDVGRFFHA